MAVQYQILPVRFFLGLSLARGGLSLCFNLAGMAADTGDLLADARRSADAGDYAGAKSSLLVASCLAPEDASVHFELWRVSLQGPQEREFSR